MSLTYDAHSCWAHLAVEEQRRRVSMLVAKIDADAAARSTSTRVLLDGLIQ